MLSHLERVGHSDTALLSHTENANSSRRAKPIGPTACSAPALSPPYLPLASHGGMDGTSVAGLLGKACLQDSRTPTAVMDGTDQYTDGEQCHSLAHLVRCPSPV